MLRKTALLLSLCIGLFYFAAAQQTGAISGVLYDSSGKQALGLATVTVFRAADTSVVTYRLSNPEGKFKVPGIPFQLPCRIIVSYTGFAVYRKEFTLTAEKPDLNLDTVFLQKSSLSLDEVLIIAERPPMSIRRDTIEFNAEAFKTLPTAIVEDLLRKLPGVEVAADGSIKVNGRKVNRIQVDGKDFFGNDPKMATRNLPANVIDKIQVTEDKEEREQNPDGNSALMGQVINLKLKRSVKKGWFGKAVAGAGTDSRYEGGLAINSFRDTLQLSIVGFSNNVNRSSFTFSDIQQLGGFDRSGANSISINDRGGFAINGISFGGTGEGIQRSNGAGLNLSFEPSKKMSANLQYFIGQSRTDIEQVRNTQQFFNDTVLNNRTNRISDNSAISHRLGGRLRWNLDSFARITVRPSLEWQETITNINTNTSLQSNKAGQLNNNTNSQTGDANNFRGSLEVSLFRSFRKKGRTLNAFIRGDKGQVMNDQFNLAENFFYSPGGNTQTTLNQLRNTDNQTSEIRYSIDYREPLTDKIGLRLVYSDRFYSGNENLNTFFRNSGGQTFIDSLSNGAQIKLLTRNPMAGLNFKFKKLQFTISARAQWLEMDASFAQRVATVRQRFFNLMPALEFLWKEFRLGYNVNVSPPRASDLQPVVNNSNPLFLEEGNPALKPTITRELGLNYNKYLTARQMNIFAWATWEWMENDVIRERFIDNKGIQVSRPVNVDGNYEISSNMGINKQYKLQNKWQFSWNIGYWTSYNARAIFLNGRRDEERTWNLNPWAGFRFNWNDVVEFGGNFSPGRYQTRYSSDFFPPIKAIVNSMDGELVLRWPKKIVWESRWDYDYNSQTAPGLRKSRLLWNGSVTFVFLKGDKGQLKFAVNDILNQNLNISRITNQNYIEDRQTTVLKRFAMMSFIYNLRNFGAGKKVGGRQSFFLF